MLSTHFNCLNDQLKNKGFTNEEIALKLESLGYSADSIVYNEPVLFLQIRSGIKPIWIQ